MEIFLISAMLVVLSICDIKEKQLPVALIGLFVAVCIVLSLIKNEGLSVNMFYAILPGVFILLASIVTRGKIGLGDGLVLIGLGPCVGVFSIAISLGIGLAVLSITGGILTLAKKINKKAAMPFMPFLLVGFLASSVIC